MSDFFLLSIFAKADVQICQGTICDIRFAGKICRVILCFRLRQAPPPLNHFVMRPKFCVVSMHFPEQKIITTDTQ